MKTKPVVTISRTWPALVGVLLLGCGDYSPADPSDDLTEVSAVVSGAQNISDGIVPNSFAEAETAAIGMGSMLAVAYNVTYIPIPNERCSGRSEIGMSYSNPGWKGIHFGPPAGVALLRGDPSIAGWDPGTTSYNVYVSTLAHSSAQWNTLPKLADGCISLTTFHSTTPDEVCVITLSMPKTGGAGATITGRTCMTSGGSMDGTALTVANGVPYVASWNTGTGLTFFRGSDGARLAAPLAARTIKGHPIFTKNTFLDLFAPDSQGTFWWTSYNVSTGTWSAEQSVPGANPFQWGGSLPLGLKGGKDYAAAYLPGSAGPGMTYLFYRDTRGLIVGYGHSSGGIPGWTLAFTSPAGFSAFHPAVAVATVPNEFPPYTGFHLALSYWDTSGGPGGSAGLRYTNDLSATPSVIASETPCPHLGYWGDYDEMAVLNNGTSNPTFYRFFTDSTKSACLTDTTDWSTNTPQHVSLISHAR